MHCIIQYNNGPIGRALLTADEIARLTGKGYSITEERR